MYGRSCRVTEEYQNMLKLFPTAQFPVQEVVRYCRSDPRIERVTVFGSALETRHNPWSDIDLYIEGVTRNEILVKPRTASRDLDIITPDMLETDERFLKEIRSKGVVVYERQQEELC